MKEFLSTLLTAIITAAVPVLTAYAVGYIQQAGKRLQASTTDIKKQGYIKEITDAVANAVEATSQTYVDALKKNGTFTEDAQLQAAQKALITCLATISPAARSFIEAAYGDLQSYLATRIEAEVRRQKNNSPVMFSLPVQDSVPDATAVAASTAAATAATIAQTAVQQLKAEPGTTEDKQDE